MATISIGGALHPMSERLYGVFLEDINYAVDGGLNANMVNNYSFDGVYLRHRSLHLHGRERWQCESDPLRFWRFVGLRAESCGARVQGERGQWIDTSRQCPAPPVHANSRYVRVTRLSHTNKSYIENLGYNGGGEREGECAMAVEAGETYEFSALVRTVAGRGRLGVRVIDEDCVALVEAEVVTLPEAGSGWTRVRCTLEGTISRYGRLRIDVLDDQPCGEASQGGAAGGSGEDDDLLTVDLDCVSLMRADSWGVGDLKWRHGRLRRDLVEAIAALRPSFVRFPGGCIAEGVTPGNEYRWKDTVGALPARRQKPNMWAYKTPDGSSYSQSYQIGFYEYFCLCEDLGAKPLPTLFAGISCQSPYRDPQHMPIESDAFRAVIGDYLDLIDFANGDPANGGWAAVRAAMGHPGPFGLDMIGVGNENFGADYQAKFDAISSAVHDRHPDMLCVMSAGLFPFSLPMRPAWRHARAIAAGHVPGATGELLAARGSATGDAIVVDEHSYHSPEWFIGQAHRFDDYPRDGAGVYFGEYSANGFFAAQPQTERAANQWRSALAEAAFLTGCERNSDVVRMTSYAPLLALVSGKVWNHNLIEFSPSRVSPTVNAEAERLFSAHVGRTAYAADVAGAAGEDADGRLFVSASGEDEPFRRIVKIVNVSGDAESATVEVRPSAAAVDAGRLRLRVETLYGGPHAKNALDYEGEASQGIQRRVNESRLPVDEGRPLRFALSLKPWSVTLVELGERGSDGTQTVTAS
ncbi:alpha-L-arabinofuranosidase C-terminal domain-containing protein [Bifidobacterium avesanii]|uniref:non-reducing end alpha-L-arabinofuranosidase n=1 Tax=Bifidobacterium avesanii TaxID=1798157 RepID=A0A7K3TFP6_9BIFI|nr:alpha-L-arabinofuranosidase C-terminal domain-containing protein [Bifidobacterium avesanii]KAB8291453.1 alpha-L-arabinofuranosidase A [Bifidobacterium avesanii]NEG77915.1 alpha-L-arabinofuranosidase [Bifidobacterium avesanii]